MIGRITGTVQDRGLSWLIINTPGGVGYKVSVTSAVIGSYPVGSDLSLLTHLVVREDQMSLYGFLTEPELNFFTQLISISGVGPKSALGVLNAGKVEDMVTAVHDANVAIFTTISGIGKKTAERIIVELKNKVGADDVFTRSREADDLLTALAGLGYNAYEIKQILPDIPSDLKSSEDRIKYALKLLGK